MPSFRQICAVSLFSTMAIASNAAPINPILYGSLTGTGLITFDGLGSQLPGTNYDNVIALTGASFGERFAGQTTSTSPDGFDVLAGTPSNPLTPAAGEPSRNLVVVLDADVQSEVLAGLSSLGYPSFDAIGEGAISVKFDAGQSEFGFQVVQAGGGRAMVGFYRADGSLISELDLALPSQGNRFFAFSREGGIQDIAGFTISNDDLGGIGIDNVKFSPDGGGQPVPEPSTLALLGLGIAGLLARRRR